MGKRRTRKSYDKEFKLMIVNLVQSGRAAKTVAENFFKILKSEMVDHKYYYSFTQARNDIFEFIEVWYNRKRIHSVLDYKSPEQFMKLYNQKVA